METFTIQQHVPCKPDELLHYFTTVEGLSTWICGGTVDFPVTVEEQNGEIFINVGQDHYFSVEVLVVTSELIELKQIWFEDIESKVEIHLMNDSRGTNVEVKFTGEMTHSSIRGTLEECYRQDWKLQCIKTDSNSLGSSDAVF